MKILLVEIIVVVALFRYVHSVSHWLTDSNKNSVLFTTGIQYNKKHTAFS